MLECHYGVPMTGGVLNTLNTRLEDNYRVGDTVTLTILRAGAEMQVQMLLSEEPR